MQDIITFDGTAASGKGSIAKAVADYYQIKYLDTGKLYRAISFLIIENNSSINYKHKLKEYAQLISLDLLANKQLDNENIGVFASQIAQDLEVRKVLFDFQLEFLKINKSCVLDGRDTGSVIAPMAKFKFYIDAQIKVRAERRYLQNQAYYVKNNISLQDLIKKIQKRDEQDKSRKIAPLIVPEGAIIIDNSKDKLLSIIQRVIKIIDNNSN
jgi:cytidylate kinase